MNPATQGAKEDHRQNGKATDRGLLQEPLMYWKTGKAEDIVGALMKCIQICLEWHPWAVVSVY